MFDVKSELLFTITDEIEEPKLHRQVSICGNGISKPAPEKLSNARVSSTSYTKSIRLFLYFDAKASLANRLNRVHVHCAHVSHIT